MPSKQHGKGKPEDVAALQESLIKRMIQTGEWDRISSKLRDLLAESGWTDETFHHAKEYSKQQHPLHFQTLMAELVPKAESSIPDHVKTEILALIRAFISTNTAG